MTNSNMVSKTIKISRSGLKLFLDCPRCFWLDVNHKIKRPPSFPYTLASAVDFLVKQEFDKYREKGTLPPIFEKNKIKAELYAGEDLQKWRHNFTGIQYYDESLNATLYGAVDDILEFPDNSLAVVDYKSTGSTEIRIYDDYQKQMDVYTWLLQRNGFKTSDNAYFVYYIVDKTGGGFANALPFNEELREVGVRPEWVSDAFEKAITTARQKTVPKHALECVHCKYVAAAGEHMPQGTTHQDVDEEEDYQLIENQE
jgi:hypothetical protein